MISLILIVPSQNIFKKKKNLIPIPEQLALSIHHVLFSYLSPNFLVLFDSLNIF